MRRFGRRARRRSTVRWLTDESGFAQVTGLPLTGPLDSNGTEMDLIPEFTQPGSLAQQGAAGALHSNFSREEDESLIIDHIKGKVGWTLEGNDGVGGAVDAGGRWIHLIRAAIAIVPRTFDPSGAALAQAVAPELVAGIAGTTLSGVNLAKTLIDPSSQLNLVQQGSHQPDGVRFLWRRMWMTSMFWSGASNAGDGPETSEGCCPPGPYVDIKPKRLLRANDKLVLVFVTQALPGVGADGTARVWVSHDLRVAAHNTRRRR